MLTASGRGWAGFDTAPGAAGEDAQSPRGMALSWGRLGDRRVEGPSAFRARLLGGLRVEPRAPGLPPAHSVGSGSAHGLLLGLCHARDRCPGVLKVSRICWGGNFHFPFPACACPPSLTSHRDLKESSWAPEMTPGLRPAQKCPHFQKISQLSHQWHSLVPAQPTCPSLKAPHGSFARQ